MKKNEEKLELNTWFLRAGDVKRANKNSYMSHTRCGYELYAYII